MSDESSNTNLQAPPRLYPWRIAGWICLTVIVSSTLSCVMLAVVRSVGLTRVTVTALNADAEPRDHGLPLIKSKEALPDYQVIVMLHDGQRINLGTKPDTSAVNGLEWVVNDPVSITDIASIRLQDRDKLVSDAIAEVQISDQPVDDDNYRFVFHSEPLTSVGIQSFLHTPIGKAICAAFFIAVLVMLASIFCR